ncbi:hypothetical protein [Aliarcobacter butzleri]|uniref:hypothetical protein n=1 Tax=Aliarcobacter butzleri TaxID=28197 RepID=UPI0002295C7C|nr:hypothetical protein [Aliarcobacter butzleri]MCG3687720.1 hypothetical protein [Aliarcobacter butzleri]MCG3693449.1 hypothetical protein [Aliarcobacter butzleri]BAK70966.1 hypothetical protein ABED_1249 [Aliarcobacter butzleri ED-1]
MLKKNIKIEIVNINNFIRQIKSIKNKSNNLIQLFDLLKKVKNILLISKVKEDILRTIDGLLLLYIAVKREIKRCY